MKTALIISVYKNTTDLAVVLKSVEQQSVSDFITVISRMETVQKWLIL